MATITLTPFKIYQVDDYKVASIDPTKKQIQSIKPGNTYTPKRWIIADFNIPASLARYISTSVTGTLTNTVWAGSAGGQREAYAVALTYSGSYAVGDTVASTWVNASMHGSTSYDAPTDITLNYDNNKIQNINQILRLQFYSVKYDYNPWEFDGVTVVLTYDTNNVINFSGSMSPRSGFLNPAEAHTFTASPPTNQGNLINYAITGGTFYYRQGTSGAYTSKAFTGTTVSIPAGTLTGNTSYQAYMNLTAQDGQTATTETGTFSTVDAIPSVSLISPINEVVYGTATFKWNYSISTGTQQKAVDLQTSTDGSTWTNLMNHVETTATSYTSDIEASGTVYWRVRGYNQDNVASAWSAAATFINNVPPEAPTITSISSTGRPVITWAASNQIAYQVQILLNGEVLEDSGAVYSGESSYRATEYYPDNTYTIKVRIYNQYGKASDWAESEYTEAGEVTPPVFTVTSTDDGALIEITTVPAVGTYYIKRNGVLIGRAVNGRYVDRFASGPTTYTVVAVTTDDYDAMSTQTVNIEVESNMLITEAGEVFEVNHRLGSPVGVSKQVNAVFDTAEFIGASTPEHHFAKMRESRFTVVFKDYVDAESLLGQTVYYADMFGNGAWCAVTSVGRVESRYGNETTAELQVTRHTETASYD